MGDLGIGAAQAQAEEEELEWPKRLVLGSGELLFPLLGMAIGTRAGWEEEEKEFCVRSREMQVRSTKKE